MVVAPRSLTLEDFLSLPEEEPPLEFADGVVTQKVSPQGKHSTLQSELVEFINRTARPGKIARAYTELRSTFSGASRVPDVAVYLWERIPRDPDGEVSDTFTEPPDIAFEIASPEQSATTLVRRCLWFVSQGVQIAILIDPRDRSVLQFRAGKETVAWHGEDKIDLNPVLPDFSLTVAELFATLR